MLDPLEEPRVQELLRAHARADPDRDLAAHYAPILLFDAQEPFLPLVTGYTVLRESVHSPSAHRHVELGEGSRRRAAAVIEYAIWWDWDIAHLYELEHVWVYVDANGEVIHAEASRHGGYRKMLADGAPPLTGSRVTLYSEAGKHSFAPAAGWLEKLAPVTRKLCTRHAGLEGVLITWLFRGIIRKTPESDRLVHTYLEHYAFEPTLDFRRPFPIAEDSLVPWPALYEWIPQRVTWWVHTLRQTIPPERRRFLRIAQRGASAYAPENTRAAIVKAAEHGADMVKLDVQHSADGVPVVFHGPDLSRTTGSSGPVSSQALHQLKLLDAGGGESIPTLEEAIGCCRAHHLGLYLELQTEAVIEPVVSLIQSQGLHDRVGLCAYEPAWLAAVKALDRRIVTAILLGSPGADAIALARAAGADYVHAAWGAGPPDPHEVLTPEWLAAIRRAGLGVISDHGRCLCDLPALRQRGVDGITTPAPDLLLQRAG